MHFFEYLPPSLITKHLQVLLDGLHDPESPINLLREPNDVRRPVMEGIWAMVAEDWQVVPHSTATFLYKFVTIL